MSTTFFYHALAALNENVEFDSSESTHITKSLRLKTGDGIELTNGRGELFWAELAIDKHRVSARVIRQLATRDFFVPLHIGIAPTKNADRIEWFVEKAVELGVGEISLLKCIHSERSRISIERVNRVAIAALKQSQRTYLPLIHDSVDFTEWIMTVKEDRRFIAHCMENIPRQLFRDSIKMDKRIDTREMLLVEFDEHNKIDLEGSGVCVAIGPEGDFSEAEVVAAQSNSFLGVSLGTARLRTETAALAAVFTYNLLNQH